MKLAFLKTNCIWFIVVVCLFGSLNALGQNQPTGDYVLGPNDGLRITVFEHPDMTTDLRISESGNIRFPLIGEVPLAGLTVNAAEERVAERLRTGGFVKKPQINILVTQYRGQQVSVLGQVNRPGRYPIEAPTKLSDMMALAGGIAQAGGRGRTRARCAVLR